MADGSRPTNENRLQRSPCSTDSSRKPVPSPTSFGYADTGVSGRPATPPTPGRRCGPGEAPELLASRADLQLATGHDPNRRKKHGALAGVASAAALLLDHEQQHVAVAVVVGRLHPLAVARGLALAPELLAAAAPEPRPALVQRAPQRYAFIHAIISTLPVPWSWTMAGTRPSSL